MPPPSPGGHQGNTRGTLGDTRGTPRGYQWDIGDTKGTPGGHRGTTGGHKGDTGGHRGTPGGHRGTPGGHRRAPRGHRGTPGGHNGIPVGYRGHRGHRGTLALALALALASLQPASVSNQLPTPHIRRLSQLTPPLHLRQQKFLRVGSTKLSVSAVCHPSVGTITSGGSGRAGLGGSKNTTWSAPPNLGGE